MQVTEKKESREEIRIILRIGSHLSHKKQIGRKRKTGKDKEQN